MSHGHGIFMSLPELAHRLVLFPTLVGLAMNGGNRKEDKQSTFISEVASTVVALLVVGAVTGGIAGTVVAYQTNTEVQGLNDRLDRLGKQVKGLQEKVHEIRIEQSKAMRGRE